MKNPPFCGVKLHLEKRIFAHKTYYLMETKSKVTLNHTLNLHKINGIDSIMYLKGDINYTDVVYLGGKKNTIAHTLKRFEKASQFQHWLRIHRAYLVNPNYVMTVCFLDSTLQLKSGEILPISRRKLLSLKGNKSLKS
jgi:DNA-binding LytR/AlgR family response regulator